MSSLKSSVQEAILSYVQQNIEEHSPTDVLRVVRDEATLMYERQLVFDALDSDPLESLGDSQPQVNRIKRIMQIAHCSRVVTVDGYSSIDAVVELQRDEAMHDMVQSYVQLTFHYERRKARPEDRERAEDGGPVCSSMGTHIWYWIELSRDFGEKFRLLTIEVWAAGESPSNETALLYSEDEMEAENVGDDNVGSNQSRTATSSQESEEMADESREEAKDLPRDKYAAFVDPETLSDFLKWTGLDNLDVGTCIFLLMTFPFYEHEWDLVGFLFDAVFGDDESELGGNRDDDIMSEDDEGEQNSL